MFVIVLNRLFSGCLCWFVDVDLVHSDGGMYFQSFC